MVANRPVGDAASGKNHRLSRRTLGLDLIHGDGEISDLERSATVELVSWIPAFAGMSGGFPDRYA